MAGDVHVNEEIQISLGVGMRAWGRSDRVKLPGLKNIYMANE